jgi:hypothetical protein
MWNASLTAAVGSQCFQFELYEFKKFHCIIYLVIWDKNFVTPKIPIVIHQATTCLNLFFFFLSVNFYTIFLNPSLQLLYSTTNKVGHCYEPKYNRASLGKLWNNSFRIVLINLNLTILCPFTHTQNTHKLPVF